MDVKKIISGLEGITSIAQTAAGVASAVGIPYAGLVKAGLNVATVLEQRITEGAVVATTQDHVAVQKIITDLEAENDKLAAQIDES